MPDYRGARAVSEGRVAIAASANREWGRVRHSAVDRADAAMEAKLHEFRDRRRNRHWHWAWNNRHPLPH